MRCETDGLAVGALENHAMTQETQARRNGSSQQMFPMILEQIRVLSRKAMGTLIVRMKRDTRQALSGTQLVMVFEHGPDPFQISFRFWSNHVIGSLISPLWNQPYQ